MFSDKNKISDKNKMFISLFVAWSVIVHKTVTTISLMA